VPPAAVAWDARQRTVSPPNASLSGGVGYLRVETDTDLRIIGRGTNYNVRRPYDIYAADGSLLRADVDNQGGQTGEESQVISLAPGQSMSSPRYTAPYTERRKSRFVPA
jgi:hypothetical protein